MDAILHPTEADVLRALIALIPPASRHAVLDELGFGSVPRNRLLEEALVSIVQAVPALGARLLGQVRLTLDQTAVLLHTTPAILAQLIKSGVLPMLSADDAAPNGPLIAAAELFKRRSLIQRRLAELTNAAGADTPEPPSRVGYESITRAFLSGLGEADQVPLIPDSFQQAVARH